MSVTPPDPLVDSVVAAVLAAKKYAALCPDTVRAIAIAELRAARSAKEAAKRVKRKLHQIGGAYQRDSMRYTQWLAELQAANDAGAQRQVCRRIMQAHASSRERWPYLEAFYQRVFSGLGAIGSVLDVACGLNPLALPWMDLPDTARYDCLDIYADQMAFLQAWLGLIGRPGKALWQDVLLACPKGAYDVALLLKTVPCLQQLDAAATLRLLATLQARTLVVSFPGRSLGGRDVGMLASYSRGFEQALQELGYDGEGQVIGDELVYVVATDKA